MSLLQTHAWLFIFWCYLLVLPYYGIMVLRYHGTRKKALPWYYGTVPLWYYVRVALWYYSGSLLPWSLLVEDAVGFRKLPLMKLCTLLPSGRFHGNDGRKYCEVQHTTTTTAPPPPPPPWHHHHTTTTTTTMPSPASPHLHHHHHRPTTTTTTTPPPLRQVHHHCHHGTTTPPPATRRPLFAFQLIPLGLAIHCLLAKLFMGRVEG